jgi:glycosyltransferase involved in cell wall biosynthesis
MVAPRFTPKSGGGGFVITNNLCKELVKNGHDVEVWASDYEADMEFWRKEYIDNPRIIPFPTNLTILGLHITLILIKFAKLSFRSLARWKETDLPWYFNVIHLQGCRTFQNIVVSHYARKYHIPYIVDAHGFPIQGTWFHKLILKTFDWLFANKIVRGASMCIAETEVGKQEYLRAGVKEENIKIIPCPYDLSIFDNLPAKGEFKRKNGIDPNKRIVGFLGGLDRIKGLDFLMESFAKINEQNDALLVLAGTDMGFKIELGVLANKLRITEKVYYTGYISGRDKLEFLVDCDVCVFPSRAEQGLPFAGLEAIMCGVPIIVTEGTGAGEDLEKMGTGFRIDFGNAVGLYSQIDSIINISDRFKWVLLDMIKTQQDYVRKNLSITEKVKDYEKVYDMVAHK